MSDDRFEDREGKWPEREKFRQALADENDGPLFDASKHGAYIDAADKPFERLARRWECERIQSGRSGDGPTPDHIGKQRFRDFWETWEKAES